jgi:hypothetical protein
MNKLMLELAKQAGLKFPSEVALSPPEIKFAELIVQDCIDQTSIGNGHGNNQWDRALTFAANNIKDHYGVKA